MCFDLCRRGCCSGPCLQNGRLGTQEAFYSCVAYKSGKSICSDVFFLSQVSLQSSGSQVQVCLREQMFPNNHTLKYTLTSWSPRREEGVVIQEVGILVVKGVEKLRYARTCSLGSLAFVRIGDELQGYGS